MFKSNPFNWSVWNLLTIVILATTVYSCKKDQTFTKLNSATDETANKMQAWLAKQKTDSVVAYKVNNLLTNANWKTAHTVIADSGKVYQIVSLPDNTTFDDPSKTEQRYLALMVTNDVTTGYIFNLYGNKADIVGKADAAISNFENNIITNFTGAITLSNWRNVAKSVKIFDNGTNTFTRVLSNKPHSKTVQTSKKVNTCIDWYWEYYVGDIWIAEEYAYSTCDGAGDSCAQEAVRTNKGNLSIRSNCNGGGGGGGNSSESTITTDVLLTMDDPGGDDGSVSVSSVDNSKKINDASSIFSRVQYEYPVHIVSGVTSGDVVECSMGPAMAYPANQQVILPNGITGTRNVYVNTYSTVCTPGVHIVNVSWGCTSYFRITYSNNASNSNSFSRDASYKSVVTF